MHQLRFGAGKYNFKAILAVHHCREMTLAQRIERRWLPLVIYSCLWPFMTGLAPAPPFATYEFGFSLNPTLNEELYTLWIYKVYEGNVIDSHPVTLGTFMMEARGMQYSRANPSEIDLFGKYDITLSDAPDGSQQGQAAIICPSIELLPKLRYGPNAMETLGTGWAQEPYAPSLRQQIILQAYRSPLHDHWQGPYFGTQAFLLLHDLLDPEWVRSYSEGG